MVKYRFALTVLLSTIFLTNTSTSSFALVKSAWYNHYESLETPQTIQLLEEGLKQAAEFLGMPAIKINKVHLRLSTPKDKLAKIKRNFALTEINDAENGIYTIYLNRRPSEYAFHGQLGHEIAHLINPHIHDAYMEGLCTLFSEIFVKKNNLDWSGWEQYYRQNNEQLYSKTYFMMRDIYDVVGENSIKTIQQFVTNDSQEHSEAYIDIEKWILTLPKAQQVKIKKIIAKYAPDIEISIKNDKRHSHPLAFVIPQ